MRFFWPMIFVVIWYFISFQAAIVIGLLYIHGMILLWYMGKNSIDAIQTKAKTGDGIIQDLRHEIHQG